MPQPRCMLIQLHSREIFRTKLWQQHCYSQTFRGASDKAKICTYQGEQKRKGKPNYRDLLTHLGRTGLQHSRHVIRLAGIAQNFPPTALQRRHVAGVASAGIWRKSVTKSSQLLKSTSQIMATYVYDLMWEKKQINSTGYWWNDRQMIVIFGFELTRFYLTFSMKDMIFGASKWLIICILLTFNFIRVLDWSIRADVNKIRS